jgi:hypothetical protein
MDSPGIEHSLHGERVVSNRMSLIQFVPQSKLISSPIQKPLFAGKECYIVAGILRKALNTLCGQNVGVSACEPDGVLECYLDCLGIIRVAELKRIRWERHVK